MPAVKSRFFILENLFNKTCSTLNNSHSVNFFYSSLLLSTPNYIFIPPNKK